MHLLPPAEWSPSSCVSMPPPAFHSSPLLLPAAPAEDDDRLILVFANGQGVCQVMLGGDEPVVIVTPHAFA